MVVVHTEEVLGPAQKTEKGEGAVFFVDAEGTDVRGFDTCFVDDVVEYG